MLDFEQYGIVYTLDEKVRDSEVDMHRGVANFTYLSYAQHIRHEYLKSIGIDIDQAVPVVKDATAEYINFLTAGDRYRSELRIHLNGRVRYHFLCSITNLATGKLSFQSDQTIIFFDAGGPPATLSNWKAIRRDIVGEAQALLA